MNVKLFFNNFMAKIVIKVKKIYIDKLQIDICKKIYIWKLSYMCNFANNANARPFFDPK